MRLERTHVGAPLEQFPRRVLKRLSRNAELLQRHSRHTTQPVTRRPKITQPAIAPMPTDRETAVLVSI